MRIIEFYLHHNFDYFILIFFQLLYEYILSIYLPFITIQSTNSISFFFSQDQYQVGLWFFRLGFLSMPTLLWVTSRITQLESRQCGKEQRLLLRQSYTF